MKQGYPTKSVNGGRKFVHTLIAERVLGRELKQGECVHHFDEDKKNNQHSNLVVCQDQAYHSLLHKRMKAKLECGDANALRCYYCKQYDREGMNGMVRSGKSTRHSHCLTNYNREWRRRAA